MKVSISGRYTLTRKKVVHFNPQNDTYDIYDHLGNNCDGTSHDACNYLLQWLRSLCDHHDAALAPVLLDHDQKRLPIRAEVTAQKKTLMQLWDRHFPKSLGSTGRPVEAGFDPAKLPQCVVFMGVEWRFILATELASRRLPDNGLAHREKPDAGNDSHELIEFLR